jgi:hypothetical protein
MKGHSLYQLPFFDKDGNRLSVIVALKVGDIVYRRISGHLVPCEVTGTQPITTRSDKAPRLSFKDFIGR